jgi:hypothetical protein
MKQIRPHLTYANAMSTLAVFLLLGGASAYAAKKHTQKIGTTQIKASAVTTAKIKNSAVDSSKLRDGAVTNAELAAGSVAGANLQDGSVGSAKIAADAVTGEKVAESTLGEVPSASSANPAVFAQVNANGTVDSGDSKGLTSPNVSKAGNGTYCITVPSFVPRGAQVTPQANGTALTAANLTLGSTPSCPTASLQVLTFNSVAPSADLAFFIAIYR